MVDYFELQICVRLQLTLLDISRTTFEYYSNVTGLRGWRRSTVLQDKVICS